MNTKEAIKCVKDKYESYDGEWCAGTKEVEKCYKEQDKVIGILKRGEKFEAMFNDIGKHRYTDIEMEKAEIKAKYFPK